MGRVVPTHPEGDQECNVTEIRRDTCRSLLGERAMSSASSTAPCSADGLYSPHYAHLADALLGRCVRPFARFAPPADIHVSHWYPQSNLVRYKGLARVLAPYVNGSYMIEVGSFIGDSATVWARYMQQASSDAVIVCMDTWLGDVNMWTWKKRWLGPQGIAGEPRLFEQFMTNIAAYPRFGSRVLPVRTTASVGLRYVQRLLKRRQGTRHGQFLGRPALIYLDSAHEYPETLDEMRLAWAVLPPGGFLLGDDYDTSWPGVVWSLNEFVSGLRASEVAHVDYACGWGLEELRQPKHVPKGRNGTAWFYPMLLTAGSHGLQWLVRKAAAPRSIASRRTRGRLDEQSEQGHASSCFQSVEISGWFPTRVQRVAP